MEKSLNVAGSCTVGPEPMPPAQGPCLLIQHGASGFRTYSDSFTSPLSSLYALKSVPRPSSSAVKIYNSYPPSRCGFKLHVSAPWSVSQSEDVA